MCKRLLIPGSTLTRRPETGHLVTYGLLKMLLTIDSIQNFFKLNCDLGDPISHEATSRVTCAELQRFFRIIITWNSCQSITWKTSQHNLPNHRLVIPCHVWWKKTFLDRLAPCSSCQFPIPTGSRSSNQSYPPQPGPRPSIHPIPSWSPTSELSLIPLIIIIAWSQPCHFLIPSRHSGRCSFTYTIHRLGLSLSHSFFLAPSLSLSLFLSLYFSLLSISLPISL